MKLLSSEIKIVLILYTLFYFLLPYVRYLAIEHIDLVVPLSIQNIKNPQATLTYLRYYACFSILTFFLFYKLIPRKKYVVAKKYQAKSLIIIQLSIVLICISYLLSGIKVSFLNVIISSLTTFVVISLGYSSFKIFYKYFLLFISVLITGRGLVAVYIFYQLLKSTFIQKVFFLVFLVAFMFSLDYLRNGGSSTELFSFIKSLDLQKFALLTYSFPFFDMVNGVQQYVSVNGTRSSADFYSNLWFHIPRVIYLEKPFLYGDEIALTKLIFGVDPRIATLAVTGAGISKVYYGDFALFIGPIVDTFSIIISFCIIDKVYRQFGNDAKNILKIFVLIKIMRNGQEYLFTAFLWLICITLIIILANLLISKLMIRKDAPDKYTLP